MSTAKETPEQRLIRTSKTLKREAIAFNKDRSAGWASQRRLERAAKAYAEAVQAMNWPKVNQWDRFEKFDLARSGDHTAYVVVMREQDGVLTIVASGVLERKEADGRQEEKDQTQEGGSAQTQAGDQESGQEAAASFEEGTGEGSLGG